MPPSCVTGNITASGGNDATCSLGGEMAPANGGMCNNMSHPVTAYVKATPPGPTGGSCSAAETVTKPPTGATHGETCSGETTFGAGCSGTQVCALVPAGYSACIHHGGANMGCQAGYATPHAVGTLQDTRGCGPCMCGMPTATCSGNWDLYSSQGCTGAITLSVLANGQCDPTGNSTFSQMFQSNILVVPPTNVTCATPAPPPPTGSVMLAGADTVCCE
jgi:hypothetical protein